MIPAHVVAVLVTYRRENELRRLLKSLRASTLPLAGCIVVDHAARAATAAVVSQSGLPAHYLACPDNPGPGAGWKIGMETALRRHPALTHFLVLDDDVLLPPDTVARLVAAMKEKNAAMTCPMLVDAAGLIWGFPEPLDPLLRPVIRRTRTPGDAVRFLGVHSLEFAWCTGACVLVCRAAVARAGFHWTDFWMLGEDLEFSMRMSHAGGGYFLPDVFVPHLPPPAGDPDKALQADRLKFCSLLQNLAYLSFHSPHSRHMRSYLPGNIRRYFRTHGWFGSTWRDVAHCLWFGAVKGQPAGREGGQRLRERLKKRG